MKFNLNNFDGEYFAQVFLQIFIKTTLFFILILSVINVVSMISNDLYKIQNYTCARDTMNILLCILFFVLIYTPKLKYENNWRLYYMGGFMLANFILQQVFKYYLS